MILKIYKITSIAILKTETYISFLNLHLNVKLTKFCQHHKQSDMKKLVVKSYKKIQNFIITQICTSHNKLIVFLNKTCISDFLSLICLCSQIRKMMKHVIIYCNRFIKH